MSKRESIISELEGTDSKNNPGLLWTGKQGNLANLTKNLTDEEINALF
jgi:hypothetical protein